MIKYTCDKCGKDITKHKRVHIDITGEEKGYFKIHLCKNCLNIFLRDLDNLIKKNERISKTNYS